MTEDWIDFLSHLLLLGRDGAVERLEVECDVRRIIERGRRPIEFQCPRCGARADLGEAGAELDGCFTVRCCGGRAHVSADVVKRLSCDLPALMSLIDGGMVSAAGEPLDNHADEYGSHEEGDREGRHLLSLSAPVADVFTTGPDGAPRPLALGRRSL